MLISHLRLGLRSGLSPSEFFKKKCIWVFLSFTITLFWSSKQNPSGSTHHEAPHYAVFSILLSFHPFQPLTSPSVPYSQTPPAYVLPSKQENEGFGWNLVSTQKDIREFVSKVWYCCKHCITVQQFMSFGTCPADCPLAGNVKGESDQ